MTVHSDLPSLLSSASIIAKQFRKSVSNNNVPDTDLDSLYSAALLGVAKALASWDPSKSSLKTHASNKIKWEIRDHLRAISGRSYKQKQRALASFVNVDLESIEGGTRLHFDILTEGLRDSEKDVLRMFYLEGYSNEEIAKQVGRSVSWVYGTKHSALQKLRNENQRLPGAHRPSVIG